MTDNYKWKVPVTFNPDKFCNALEVDSMQPFREELMKAGVYRVDVIITPLDFTNEPVGRGFTARTRFPVALGTLATVHALRVFIDRVVRTFALGEEQF